MNRFEHTIKQALVIEQAEILKRFAEADRHALDAVRVLARRSRWRSAGLIAVLAAVLAGGLWKGRNALRADAVIDALHWGLPCAVLVVAALVVMLGLAWLKQFDRLYLATRCLRLDAVRQPGGWRSDGQAAGPPAPPKAETGSLGRRNEFGARN